jgi:hypothetical protein
MSYYMLFGGTNFDDWGALTMTETYDYNAPIRESGGVGERYQRVWALGHMLMDHGVKLARSDAVPVDATATDADVEVAERRSPDGSRYIFVRTEKNDSPRNGTVQLKEKDGPAAALTFDYQLEPFGSMVLYLPPGENDAKKGEWLPKPAPPIQRPTEGLPSPVDITQADCAADPFPPVGRSSIPARKLKVSACLTGISFTITSRPSRVNRSPRAKTPKTA